MERYARLAERLTELLLLEGPRTTAELLVLLKEPTITEFELGMVLERHRGTRWHTSGGAWLAETGETDAELRQQAESARASGDLRSSARAWEQLVRRHPGNQVYAFQWYMALSFLGNPRAQEANAALALASDLGKFGPVVRSHPALRAAAGADRDMAILRVEAHRGSPFAITVSMDGNTRRILLRPPGGVSPDRLAQAGVTAQELGAAPGQAEALVGLLDLVGTRTLLVAQEEERDALLALFRACGAPFPSLLNAAAARTLALGRDPIDSTTTAGENTLLNALTAVPADAAGRLGAALNTLFPEATLIRRVAGTGEQTGRKPEPQDRATPGRGLSIQGAFANDGPWARQREGYRFRPQQVQLAEAIHAHMTGGSRAILMAEGPTGVGKSRAYLTAARLGPLAAGEQVIISTSTRNLQVQLLSREIPDLARAMPGPFRYAMLLGADNYVCRQRADAFLAEAEQNGSPAARVLAAYLPFWLEVTNTGLVDDLLAAFQGRLPEAGGLVDSLRSDGLCRGSAHASCFCRTARQTAAGADLVVVNHALLAVDGVPQAKDRRVHLILDEAHNVESAVTGAHTRSTGNAELERLGFRASGHVGHAIRQLMDAHEVHGWRDGDEHRLRITPAVREGKPWATLATRFDELAQALTTYMSALPKGESAAPVRQACETMQTLLKELRNRRQDHVFWLELKGNCWRLCSAPNAVGPLVQKLLQPFASVTLTSATLGVNDGGDFVARRLAITHKTWLPLSSPFDHRQQAVLAVPTDVMRYAREREADYLEKASQYVVRAAHQLGGRTLVLFTSQERMEHMAEVCRLPLESLGLELLVQRRPSDRASLASRFALHRGTVLFGLASFWEGVDFPGDQLQCVIIESLPFPVPNDPILEARMAAEADSGNDGFHRYGLPLALLRFAQGCGRLIRTERDTGMVLVLDSRLGYKAYGERFVAAAPPMDLLPGDMQTLLARLREQVGRPPAEPVELPVWQQLALPAARYEDGEYRLIRSQVVTGLHRIFGHAEFRPGGWQEELVRTVLAGRPVIGVVQTGGGKSLCYQLPAVLRQGLTVVVTPVIALMKDQVDRLWALGLKEIADYYASDRDWSDLEQLEFRLRHRRVKLLYLSPEQLARPTFRALLKQAGVVQMVVDEGHCISQWGHSFRPSFLQLGEWAQELDVPVAAFTATAPESVQKDMEAALRIHGAKVVRHICDRQNLTFECIQVEGRDPKAAKLAAITRVLAGTDGAVIVYCATRDNVRVVANSLIQQGYRAAAYHGDLEGSQRAMVQELFLDGSLQVVVATNAFGMGVDHPHVRHVIHFDQPGSLEALYQEAGRAGRDGEPASCLLLYDASDADIHTYLAASGILEEDDVRQTANALRKARRWGEVFLDSQVEELVGADKARILRHWFANELGWVTEARASTEVTITDLSGVTYVPAGLTPSEQRFAAEVLEAKGSLRLVEPATRHQISLVRAEQILGLMAGEKMLRWQREESAVQLMATARLPGTHDVVGRFPWKRIEQQKKQAEASLKAVAAYAATGTCRVAILHQRLDGEPVTRCGRCDNCLKKGRRTVKAPERLSDEMAAERLILQIIADLPNRRGAGAHLSTLTGRQLFRQHPEMTEHPLRGRLAHYPYEQLKTLVETVENYGRITADDRQRLYLTQAGIRRLAELGGSIT